MMGDGEVRPEIFEKGTSKVGICGYVRGVLLLCG